jgi:hypothetical protein
VRLPLGGGDRFSAFQLWIRGANASIPTLMRVFDKCMKLEAFDCSHP